MENLEEVLAKRLLTYGPFFDQATICQKLKRSIKPNIEKLADDQIEALDMIFNKIGRILNGDPNYADSWVDIAGYAQLIANRLILEQPQQ